MPIKPATPEAYQLLHEGTIALAQVEHNGVRIDVPYFKKQIEDMDKDIRKLENELKEDPIYTKWRRRFGSKTNLGSRDQIAQIVFGDLGYEAKEYTTGRYDEKLDVYVHRPKANEAAFESIDLPFVKTYIQCEKIKKGQADIKGILRETCEDGFAHCMYGLNIARTYRSKCESFNFQNQQVRNQKIAKIIRSGIIPRDGFELLEADLKVAEVRVGFCYHKDPTMKSYLLDDSKDMHRDMAAQIYMIPKEQVSKDARYAAKNKYVFPEFYGSDYVNCAPNLWEYMNLKELKTNDGVPLQQILKKNGITSLGSCDRKDKPKKGTFARHIYDIDQDFWGRRFRQYAKWKEDWYQKYLKTGGFMMYTGFWVEGIYGKNDVTNYPIQGPAFHCDLWGLIQLQKWINKNKLRSKIIGQIHDSILVDVHRREKDLVAEKIIDILSVQLTKHWKWLIIPMVVEIETSDTNWYDKKPYHLAA